jgi:2-oxo-4-hydroxy-4-carboxy--5-ureidoimidazoline (OHCU) decarboxylase
MRWSRAATGSRSSRPRRTSAASSWSSSSIGARSGLSARSAAEQGADGDPGVLADLAYLNQVYEETFGFRFVVFVNRRPKAEILEVLRERLQRTRDEELETALQELVAIARDRWERG